ncbi:MAG: hypothetical protein ACSHW0_02145 [Thalassotalea sp.]
MKCHVFIATTQGVVAIQDVIPLNDPDIHSLISVNGTATVANISSSYHNFVKKGSGLIHQDFACCSYRINISQRIDQGNSWQLAIYLAHLLAANNLLAYGDIQADEQIIIATGEINTSNRNIQAVQGVEEKYHQIVEFINNSQLAHQPFAAFNHQPIFLLPEQNADALMLTIELFANAPTASQQDKKCEQSNIEIVAITQLSELLTLAPLATLTQAKASRPTPVQEIAATTGQAAITETVRASQKATASNLLTRLSAQFSNQLTDKTRLAIIAGFAVIVLLIIFLIFFNTASDKTAEFAQQTEPAVTAEKSSALSLAANTQNMPVLKVNNQLTEAVSLQALYAKYRHCEQQTETQVLVPEKQQFSAINRHNLCQLSFITSADVKQVYWLANNKSSLASFRSLSTVSSLNSASSLPKLNAHELNKEALDKKQLDQKGLNQKQLDQNKLNAKIEWIIPLPAKQQSDISYFLIVLFHESAEVVPQTPQVQTVSFEQQLNDFLTKEVHSPKITAKPLTRFLTDYDKYAQPASARVSEIYQHKLEVF